jgi:hypothetical protein
MSVRQLEAAGEQSGDILTVSLWTARQLASVRNAVA